MHTEAALIGCVIAVSAAASLTGQAWRAPAQLQTQMKALHDLTRKRRAASFRLVRCSWHLRTYTTSREYVMRADNCLWVQVPFGQSRSGQAGARVLRASW
ncbi:hypothetical protein DA102_033675 [Sinorhizobium meliloti]|nr:hypothetical protein DA102_033675 [Sinorhizobium meliloti]